MTPQPKTIAEIAKENLAANAPAKPPKPPSAGGRIHAKWLSEIEKFVGPEVEVRCAGERVYVGRLLAQDVNQQHVILKVGADTILIRNVWTITRGPSTALSPTSGLAGESKPITEKSGGIS